MTKKELEEIHEILTDMVEGLYMDEVDIFECMNFGGPKDCFGHLHCISFNLYDENGNELTDENRYTSRIYFKCKCDECGFETMLSFDPDAPTILY